MVCMHRQLWMTRSTPTGVTGDIVMKLWKLHRWWYGLDFCCSKFKWIHVFENKYIVLKTYIRFQTIRCEFVSLLILKIKLFIHEFCFHSLSNKDYFMFFILLILLVKRLKQISNMMYNIGFPIFYSLQIVHHKIIYK